jgi:2-oxoglutarate ferredoxin oxidoreductase subunit beta
LVSTCPTNWGMTPLDAIKWAEEKMLPYYSLGVFKTPEEPGEATTQDNMQ